MKLLVFAHTPPPHHGQSAMVALLLAGLRADPEFAVLHVNARFSRDTADVGRWRPGKLFALLGACCAAWRLRWRHGRDIAFYYVPAPGKRGALYRDLVVMALCRPLFARLVLHWHAVGLGEWLAQRASAPERWLARRLLGGADLALVLAAELAADAAALRPKRSAVVPNGIDISDTQRTEAHAWPQTASAGDKGERRCEVLFLGLCSKAKGVFATLDGVALANREPSPAAPGLRFHLTVAGGFENAAEEQRFRTRAAELGPEVVTYRGFVSGAEKAALFTRAKVFCFPTCYAHEGQPLALVEALAHDVPVVTTRWRAIPGMLPTTHVWFVTPGNAAEIAAALRDAAQAQPPAGTLRRHYLTHFTVERHLATLRSALLQSLDPPTTTATAHPETRA